MPTIAVDLPRMNEPTAALVDTYRRRVQTLPKPLSKRRIRRLSPREVEVATLLVQGMSNGEITERLVISTKTLETHIQRIRQKHDLDTTRQLLVHLAYEAGVGRYARYALSQKEEPS